MNESGWWVCRNCGLANRVRLGGRVVVSGCIGCFRDATTGNLDVSQATTAVLLLGGVYFFCALIGGFGGLIVAAIPAELLFGGKRDVVYHDFLLVAGVGAGVALGLRVAWNDWVAGIRKESPSGSYPMPPTASPLRRYSELIAHASIGSIFMCFTFGLSIEKWLKGYGDDVTKAALAGLFVAGFAGGCLYFRFKPRP